MTAERRLSESEVTAVLRRASEESAQPGLTVAQVQEIAQDVGLSPEAVQRALAESASGALRPATVERQLGLPVGVSKEVLLPGLLTDAAWDVLVSQLQATFSARGKVTTTGVVREWRNGKLRIAVEPSASGHRLRMSTTKDGALQLPLILSGTALFVTSMMAVAAAAKPEKALMAALMAAVPAIAAAVSIASPFFTLPRWSRTRAAQFDAVAREAEQLVRTPPMPALRSAQPVAPPTALLTD